MHTPSWAMALYTASTFRGDVFTLCRMYDHKHSLLSREICLFCIECCKCSPYESPCMYSQMDDSLTC